MKGFAMSETIKIGDSVVWRGGFGQDMALSATVKGMALTEEPREKYGESVDEVDLYSVRENRVVFDLDNGHWCYSEQIDL
jgi:hypothetical protein